MRNYRTTAALLMFLALLGAGAMWGQAVFSRLGIGEADARGIADSAIDGSYSYYRITKPFLKLPPAMRAATVTESIAWAKVYYSSAAFKKSWANKREASKPTPPETKGTAADDVNKANADMRKQIDDMKKVAATLPPDQRKAVETAIQQMTAQTEAALKDPQRQALQRQSAEANRANEQKRYQDETKHWQEDFPADANAIIARRLHNFLNISANVNFDAKLANSGGRLVFADAQYERMPSDWKICYRAGREATAAARAGATAWLKELGK